MVRTERCFIKGCSSKYTKPKLLSFFSIPKGKDNFEAWKAALQERLSGSLLSNSFGICELHFEEKYVLKTGTKTLKGARTKTPRSRVMLAKGAIPSIFPDIPEGDTGSPIKTQKPSKRKREGPHEDDEDALPSKKRKISLDSKIAPETSLTGPDTEYDAVNVQNQDNIGLVSELDAEFKELDEVEVPVHVTRSSVNGDHSESESLATGIPEDGKEKMKSPKKGMITKNLKPNSEQGAVKVQDQDSTVTVEEGAVKEIDEVKELEVKVPVRMTRSSVSIIDSKSEPLATPETAKEMKSPRKSSTTKGSKIKGILNTSKNNSVQKTSRRVSFALESTDAETSTIKMSPLKTRSNTKCSDISQTIEEGPSDLPPSLALNHEQSDMPEGSPVTARATKLSKTSSPLRRTSTLTGAKLSKKESTMSPLRRTSERLTVPLKVSPIMSRGSLLSGKVMESPKCATSPSTPKDSPVTRAGGESAARQRTKMMIASMTLSKSSDKRLNGKSPTKKTNSKLPESTLDPCIDIPKESPSKGSSIDIPKESPSKGASTEESKIISPSPKRVKRLVSPKQSPNKKQKPEELSLETPKSPEGLVEMESCENSLPVVPDKLLVQELPEESVCQSELCENSPISTVTLNVEINPEVPKSPTFAQEQSESCSDSETSSEMYNDQTDDVKLKSLPKVLISRLPESQVNSSFTDPSEESVTEDEICQTSEISLNSGINNKEQEPVNLCFKLSRQEGKSNIRLIPIGNKSEEEDVMDSSNNFENFNNDDASLPKIVKAESLNVSDLLFDTVESAIPMSFKNKGPKFILFKPGNKVTPKSESLETSPNSDSVGKDDPDLNDEEIVYNDNGKVKLMLIPSPKSKKFKQNDRVPINAENKVEPKPQILQKSSTELGNQQPAGLQKCLDIYNSTKNNANLSMSETGERNNSIQTIKRFLMERGCKRLVVLKIPPKNSNANQLPMQGATLLSINSKEMSPPDSLESLQSASSPVTNGMESPTAQNLSLSNVGFLEISPTSTNNSISPVPIFQSPDSTQVPPGQNLNTVLPENLPKDASTQVEDVPVLDSANASTQTIEEDPPIKVEENTSILSSDLEGVSEILTDINQCINIKLPTKFWKVHCFENQENVVAFGVCSYDFRKEAIEFEKLVTLKKFGNDFSCNIVIRGVTIETIPQVESREELEDVLKIADNMYICSGVGRISDFPHLVSEKGRSIILVDNSIFSINCTRVSNQKGDCCYQCTNMKRSKKSSGDSQKPVAHSTKRKLW